jgi:hypothetical protein
MTEILEKRDVQRLLEEAVKSAGGQSAWARKARIERSYVNYELRGKRAPSKSILTALGLKIVYIKKSSRSRLTRARRSD